MPPEEANCLVAIRLDREGPALRARGERVFARSAKSPATISWYTSTEEPPDGYTTVLGGLLFVQTRTMSSNPALPALNIPVVDGRYSWKDNAHSKGLMIA